MSRRKPTLLFAAAAGAISVAEAVAVVLVAQVDWRKAGPLQERLRGSSPRWRDADEAEPDRN